MCHAPSRGQRKAVRHRYRLILPVLALLLPPSCPAQEQQLDFNSYYRFPASVGVEYQMLTPFAQYARGYTVFQADLGIRVPIPSLPFLQPTLELGLLRFDSLDLADPLRWDHTHYYGALGLVAAHRFARNFEVGAELLVGLSESVFPDLVEEAVAPAIGQPNLLVQLGGRIVLDPSFGFSVELHPNLKYIRGLGLLHDFDGLVLGIGFSGHFRFGQDPDAASALIRAVRFDEIDLPVAFAAMQSYYVQQPLGTVRITNTDRQPLRDVQVSFLQPGYMDSRTLCETIPELKSGESWEVDLHATFNDEVFRTEGVKPLTGEVAVSYTLRQRAVDQKESVSYDLQDKTALMWNDDRKVAAFITPQDGALRNYASFIRTATKDSVVPGASDALQYAMQVYHALGELGLLYQPDPTAPFALLQGNPQVVDSVSLPRDTLHRATGDCDDLTVLYCAMVEAVGKESAFITVPGHIYAAVNTGVAARDWATVHPDRGMTIVAQDTVWVPVEITMIGKGTFLDAWRRGMAEYAALDSDPQKRRLYLTREAHAVYRSVGLKETDLGLQYGDKAAIARGFAGDIGALVDLLLADARKEAEASGTPRAWNRLGIRSSEYGRYEPAEGAFRKALAKDPACLSAEINLANLLFLRKDYGGALGGFQSSYDKLVAGQQAGGATAQRLLVSISKAYYQLERYDEATAAFASASAIDPEKVQEYAYLAQRNGGGAGVRAAEVRDPSCDVLFEEQDP